MEDECDFQEVLLEKFFEVKYIKTAKLSTFG
jgi:hypothetical protein